MYSDENELSGYYRKDDASEREDQARRRLLIWPWLVVAGFLAIVIGIVGPLVTVH
jgi:hypothetical protein